MCHNHHRLYSNYVKSHNFSKLFALFSRSASKLLLPSPSLSQRMSFGSTRRCGPNRFGRWYLELRFPNILTAARWYHSKEFQSCSEVSMTKRLHFLGYYISHFKLPNLNFRYSSGRSAKQVSTTCGRLPTWAHKYGKRACELFLSIKVHR